MIGRLIVFLLMLAAASLTDDSVLSQQGDLDSISPVNDDDIAAYVYDDAANDDASNAEKNYAVRIAAPVPSAKRTRIVHRAGGGNSAHLFITPTKIRRILHYDIAMVQTAAPLLFVVLMILSLEFRSYCRALHTTVQKKFLNAAHRLIRQGDGAFLRAIAFFIARVFTPSHKRFSLKASFTIIQFIYGGKNEKILSYFCNNPDMRILFQHQCVGTNFARRKF